MIKYILLYRLDFEMSIIVFISLFDFDWSKFKGTLHSHYTFQNHKRFNWKILLKKLELFISKFNDQLSHSNF